MLTTAAQQSLQEMRAHVHSGATHKARARGGGGRCPGSEWEHQQGKKRLGCKVKKRSGCKGKKRLGLKWGVGEGGEGEEGRKIMGCIQSASDMPPCIQLLHVVVES